MKKISFRRSKECFAQARKFIPGGVNSPVRAFKAVGMSPLFIDRAKGPYIYDEDGNKYIDYVMSWGPMILGHAPREVIRAVSRTMADGTSFGAPTKRETELARLVCGRYPSIEKLRLTSSGTEAAMSAIRLARAFTNRDKIVKFEGCYHGHADSLLVKAGSGSATFGVPSSKGVNKSFVRDTITLPFNDPGGLKHVIKKAGKNIACVIIEPVAANMGVVPPRGDFLKELRRLTKENNILLIFDEVITGFRVARGGAQEIFGIGADLTVLGKIIGGGLPIGAFGGRGEIMDLLSPDGPVYQAGTLSGNPAAVTAGISTLKALGDRKIYAALEASGARLEAGLNRIIAGSGRKIIVQRFGSLFTLFFTGGKGVSNYSDAAGCDCAGFSVFYRRMLESGVYLAPSQFEANFLSIKHTAADIDKTLAAARYALSRPD